MRSAALEQHASAPAPDPFGYDPELRAWIRPMAEFFYRRYWRVHTQGLEHIPAAGPALIVANHSGGIPLDAVMLGSAVDLEHPEHRLVRFLYDRFVSNMPLMGELYTRLGSVTASMQNAQRLLENGDLVGIFPEGVAGVAKGIGHRYQLQPFHTGCVRLSLQLRVPIIPATVVGAEEIYPVIGKLPRFGALQQLLQVPYLPITPLFPLLGPLGMIPLPTKWHIRFGAAIRLYDDRRLRKTPTPRKVQELTERVRRHVQTMLHASLAERESIF